MSCWPFFGLHCLLFIAIQSYLFSNCLPSFVCDLECRAVLPILDWMSFFDSADLLRSKSVWLWLMHLGLSHLHLCHFDVSVMNRWPSFGRKLSSFVGHRAIFQPLAFILVLILRIVLMFLFLDCMSLESGDMFTYQAASLFCLPSQILIMRLYSICLLPSGAVCFWSTASYIYCHLLVLVRLIIYRSWLLCAASYCIKVCFYSFCCHLQRYHELLRPLPPPGRLPCFFCCHNFMQGTMPYFVFHL